MHAQYSWQLQTQAVPLACSSVRVQVRPSGMQCLHSLPQSIAASVGLRSVPHSMTEQSGPYASAAEASHMQQSRPLPPWGLWALGLSALHASMRSLPRQTSHQQHVPLLAGHPLLQTQCPSSLAACTQLSSRACLGCAGAPPTLPARIGH